ncbi:MAG: DUF6600 domain-containing protein [Candidatus Aminicenantales bacterium]
MKKTAAMILVFGLLAAARLPAEESDPAAVSVARLSYANGHVFIQRAAELDYEEGVVNMPLSEGDRMGTTDGRAEVYLGRGKYLRLDNNTKIDILDLPDPSGDLIQVQLWKGSIYLSIASLKREKAVEVHTGDLSVYILDRGLYRIDARSEETEILVFQGLAEAAGESASHLVKDAQRLEASNGHFIGKPSAFPAVAEDSFDRWSEKREQDLRNRMARRYLPEELGDFEAELASYGQWVYLPPYGYVWVPGGLSPDWRPYWHGRWVWLSSWGWTWLPYEPWGWVTFHFGRWHWSVSLGWYWIPTTIWGPAWVHWYWADDIIAWAPLSYWGYPGVVVNNVYFGRSPGDTYPYNSRALTVIHKKQLKAPDISRIALHPKDLKRLGRIRLVKTQPQVGPDAENIGVETRKQGKVRLDKSPLIPGKTKTSFPEKAPEAIPGTGQKQTVKIQKKPSTLGRIFDLLSGGRTKITKKRSSKTASPKGSAPRRRTKTSSRSGARKVKKKK